MIAGSIFCATSESHYNIHNHNDFRVPFARTVCHGTESVSYLGPKIRDIVATELKYEMVFHKILFLRFYVFLTFLSQCIG